MTTVIIKPGGDLSGLRELSQKLSEMGAAAGGKALRSGLLSASLPALRAMQAAAPTGTRVHRTYKGRKVAPGFLKRNIKRKSGLSESRESAYVLIGPTSEAFYAKFLEFGTSRAPRRPFMEPSFRSAIPQVQARLKERLTQLIAKAAKK